MAKQGDVPARVKELRAANVKPHDAHAQAMREAREASGHGRRQDQQ